MWHRVAWYLLFAAANLNPVTARVKGQAGWDGVGWKANAVPTVVSRFQKYYRITRRTPVALDTGKESGVRCEVSFALPTVLVVWWWHTSPPCDRRYTSIRVNVSDRGISGRTMLTTAMCGVMSGIMISTSVRMKVSEELEKYFGGKKPSYQEDGGSMFPETLQRIHQIVRCHIAENSHLLSLILYVSTETRFRSCTSPRVISCRQRGTGTGLSPNTSSVTCQYHSTSAPCFIHNDTTTADRGTYTCKRGWTAALAICLQFK
jgi:hypothetical protein